MGDMLSRQSACFLMLLIQPHAAAYEKGDLRFALHAEVDDPAAQILAGAGLALNAQRDHRAALGQALPDGCALGLEGLLYLRRGGLLRQAVFWQLDDVQLAVSLQALDVLRRRVRVEPLLQLSHAQDGHSLHINTSAP